MQFISKTVLATPKQSLQLQTGKRGAILGAALFIAGSSAIPAQAQADTSASIRPVYGAQPSSESGKTVRTAKTSYLVSPTGEMIPVAAPPQPQQATPLISIEFENVLVADLISMIAKQGNVGIIVGGDVEARLRNVTLINKTPEEAIRIVAQSANLAWRKIDDKTFAVANKMDELPPEAGQIKTPSPVPSNSIPNLVPTAGFDTESAYDGLDSLPQLYNRPKLQPNQAAAEEPKNYAYLPIRNVGPRFIAWWLDPTHNPEPIEFQAGRRTWEKSQQEYLARPAIDPRVSSAANGGMYIPDSNTYNPWSPAGLSGRNDGYNDIYTRVNPQFGQNNNTGGNRGGNRQGRNGGVGGQGSSGGGVFDLPAGIDSLVAVDPQNALLVYGTEEGIDALTRIIRFLDKPLRQVEIEAQFIEIATTDLNQFGIDFSSSNGPFRLSADSGITNGTFKLGYVRNNFRATLNSLVSNNRAKRVSSPRVTAINNIPASLYSSTQTPIKLNSSTSSIGGQVGESENVYFITTSIGLTVTPTINNDDTVTVVMSPQVQSQSLPFGDTGVPQVSSNTVNTIANVRDGDTIALGGLRTKDISKGGSRIPIISNIPFIGGLFKTKNNSAAESELIIFLTARILRRVEAPVPGT